MLKREDDQTTSSGAATRSITEEVEALDWTPSAASTVAPDPDTYDREAEERRRRRAEARAALAPETGEFRMPQPKSAAMILFENVTKVYPGRVVGLQDVTLQIDKGEWVFLVGPSGSGKSTFIKLLLKEIDSTRGTVIVGGRSLNKLRRSRIPQLRRNIGCVFQDFKLLPTRTVYDNVATRCRCRASGTTRSPRRCRTSSRWSASPTSTESSRTSCPAAQQQRVSIARAFVNHPALLICDEPTGNLDPETSIGIMQLLYRINRSGTTVVMATHDREMVDKMRRRVIALEDGRVVRDDRRGGYVTEQTLT